MRRNIVAILAGGSGSRFESEMPKQFFKIAGKTIIERTINIFQQSKIIDEIIIVINKQYFNLIKEIIAKTQFDKVKKIIPGGKTRSDSSLNAINEVAKYSDTNNINLLIHDAARPFVTEEIINKVVNTLEKHLAVNVAVPVTDTVIEGENKYITNIPNRSKMFNSQTPQSFHFEVIKSAYDKAIKDQDFIATDDCGVVNKYLPDVKIYLVKGDESNIKITHKSDIILAKYFMSICE